MVKAERRQKVNLTIDAQLWALCREKGRKYDLNWSQIAEEAFLNVLLQLQEVEKIVQSTSPNLEPSVVKSKLRNYINRLYLQLGQELNKQLEAKMPD